MQLTDAIEKRRSIRKYELSDISIQDLKLILEAGINAPSAKNRHPWFFYVLHDNEAKNNLIEILNREITQSYQQYESSDMIRQDIMSAMSTMECMKNAAAIIFVGYKKKHTQQIESRVCWSLGAMDIEVTDILSIGAAIQNMLLKATDLGYGSLWVCDIFYVYSKLIDFLQTDDAIVSAVCIGKKAEHPPKRSRKSLENVSLFI